MMALPWRAWAQRFRRLSVGMAVAWLASSRLAYAYEAKADGQAYLQLYSVQGLYGAPTLSRQRLTYNLGLEVVNLAGSAWNNEPWMTARFRIRMDSDYGISPAEQDPNQSDYFVPGLKTAPFDVLYAYVEGGGWFHNTTGFRAGRQLFFDELGWWSLDGVRVAFSPGHLFELAAYTGFEQRGGLPLMSTGRYEAGGVFRGSREGLAASQWPSYLQSTSLAPAAGASLVLLAIPRLHARFDYRRVWQRDQVVTSPFLDQNGNLATTSVSRVSTERAGLGLGYDFGSSTAADGAAVYDVYRSKLVEHRATVLTRPLEQLKLSLSYQYRLPTYDADSIFNWFGAVGSTLVRARMDVDLRRDLNLGVSTGVRWYGATSATQSTWTSQSQGGQRDGIGGVDATWHSAQSRLRIAQTAEIGEAGDRWVGDAMLAHRVSYGNLEPSILLSLARWRDRLRADFNSTVFSYVLACRFSPTNAPRFGIDWEHSVSDVGQQRFRVVGTVDLRWP